MADSDDWSVSRKVVMSLSIQHSLVARNKFSESDENNKTKYSAELSNNPPSLRTRRRKMRPRCCILPRELPYYASLFLHPLRKRRNCRPGTWGCCSKFLRAGILFLCWINISCATKVMNPDFLPNQSGTFPHQINVPLASKDVSSRSDHKLPDAGTDDLQLLSSWMRRSESFPTPQLEDELIKSSLRGRKLKPVEQSTTDETDNAEEQNEVEIFGNSRLFIILFGTLLGSIVFVRMATFCAILCLKDEGNLRLAQPSVLALLVLSGSVSVASCAFLMAYPSNSTNSIFNMMQGDFFCRIRNPMILTPLTLAGCILLGRVWRILLLLTPILEVKKAPKQMDFNASLMTIRGEDDNRSLYTHRSHGRSLGGFSTDDDDTLDEEDDNDDTEIVGQFFELVQGFKVKIVECLTNLSDTYYLCSLSDFYQALGCRCILRLWPALQKGSRAEHFRRRRARTNNALRKKIPTSQLLWLIFMMMIPQITLQILTQSIPSFQEHIDYESNFEVLEGYYVDRPICKSDVGMWPTFLGVAITLVPYILTGILTWNSSDDLPKAFDEACAMTKCFKTFAMTLVVALPPLLFLDAAFLPDTFVYLTSMLVFGLAIPPTWFIVYPKIYSAWWERIHRAKQDPQGKRHQRALNMRRLLQVNNGNRFLPRVAGENHDQGKSAKLALTIGKMYEEMGNKQKSLDLFNEALSVWECDPSRNAKEKTGGFTQDEINAFSVSDLEYILQLLIAKGRVEGSFNEKAREMSAANAWLDALEIYEQAPARAEFKDRSILFPLFSGIFIFLKGERIKQDEKCSFEQNLVRKFVREAKLHGDPVHYTRALAMYCEAKAQVGNYQASLNTFESLKELYDPLDHSEAVAEAYGTDRSAQAFSQSALWHMQLGNTTAALDACEYVLTDLMPLMDAKNILNSCEMLLPIMRIYKARGDCKRMRDLFDKYVIQNFLKYLGPEGKTPCKPLFKPLIALLEVCHDPGSVVDMPGLIEWLVEGDNGVLPDFVDNIYTKRCWSMHNLTAELCLRVANYIIDTDGEVSDAVVLTKKSLSLCQRAEKKMKNKKGVVILQIAYDIHEPVYAEVIEFANSLNIEIDDTELISDLNSSRNSSVVHPKNLSQSYPYSSMKASDDTTSTNFQRDEKLDRTSEISLTLSSAFQAESNQNMTPEAEVEEEKESGQKSFLASTHELAGRNKLIESTSTLGSFPTQPLLDSEEMIFESIDQTDDVSEELEESCAPAVNSSTVPLFGNTPATTDLLASYSTLDSLPCIDEDESKSPSGMNRRILSKIPRTKSAGSCNRLPTRVPKSIVHESKKQLTSRVKELFPDDDSCEEDLDWDAAPPPPLQYVITPPIVNLSSRTSGEHSRHVHYSFPS